MTGKLVVLAGPSAVGKGTVASYIHSHFPNFHLSVSATTREPRPGEQDGISYIFVDRTEFEEMIQKGELLEWAEVHGSNLYGTPKAPVQKALEMGFNVLLEIDVQGAMQVRETAPESILIFIKPPSFEALAERMDARGTESPKDKAIRMETAKSELARVGEFDFTVTNDDVERCAQEVVELTKAN
ncbi:MAG: guanylate kinase [Actinomycetota bacterium]